MILLRYWFRRMGLLAILGWFWSHRGTVLRAMDLATRAPRQLSDGRVGDVRTEARTIVALDRDLAMATDLRISQVADGTVCFRSSTSPHRLDLARPAVLGVPTVLDVRTDGTHQPTLDEELASLSTP